jgi:hypothetical protein
VGVLSLVRVDFPSEPALPTPARLALASVVSLVGSVGVDALLVVVGTGVFPSTKGYVHFRFSDYGKLTAIGVVIACVGWPVVTWLSSSARWLFLRLAIAVTLVLWLPDLWILSKGQPAKAVAVLMAMHLAIAVVTYNSLVHLAPPHRRHGVASGG